MEILRLTLEYDGTGYRGWARQPGQRTVEGVVRDALDAIFPRWDGLAVAGRTDTGVHATGQVVASVEVEGGPPLRAAAEALNRRSRTTSPCSWRRKRRPGSTRASRRRAARTATSCSTGARVAARGAAGALVAAACRRRRAPAAAAARARRARLPAFTPTETQHDVFVREVRAAAWERRGDHLHFTITADSFLRHMVRTLVGTMLEQAPQRSSGCSSGRPRAEAGVTAPPWGLYLERVDYD